LTDAPVIDREITEPASVDGNHGWLARLDDPALDIPLKLRALLFERRRPPKKHFPVRHRFDNDLPISGVLKYSSGMPSGAGTMASIQMVTPL
jgi:hypothetical protein